jgi:hypothetical protein
MLQFHSRRSYGSTSIEARPRSVPRSLVQAPFFLGWAYVAPSLVRISFPICWQRVNMPGQTSWPTSDITMGRLGAPHMDCFGTQIEASQVHRTTCRPWTAYLYPTVVRP